MQAQVERMRVWVIFITVAVAVVCSWVPAIQESADALVESGLKRALVSFATARALNAVISVAQGTDLAIEPFGVGIKLAPGQALAPINDLVANFADVMMVASIAFGVQKILLFIGGSFTISVLVTLFAAAWAALLFHSRPPSWVTKLLIVLLAVRFAIPAVAIVGDIVFHSFLKNDYEQSQASVASAAAALGGHVIEGDVVAPTESPEAGSSTKKCQWWLWARGGCPSNQEGGISDAPSGKEFSEWYKKPIEKAKEKIANIKVSAERAAGSAIRLMAIFIVETILVPIGVLWLLCWFVAGSLRSIPHVGLRLSEVHGETGGGRK